MLQRFLESTPPRSAPGSDPLASRRVLLAVAAPAEVGAILRGLDLDPGVQPTPWARREVRGDVDLVVTGIGKANAAGAVARVFEAGRHAAVLNVGIGGALPRSASISPNLEYAALGSVHIASACVFADEGLETPDAFLDCAALGFPLADFPGSAVPTDSSLVALLSPLGQVGPIATVSTCSGTDHLAQRTAQRTSAAVEAMEGSAVALVAHRLGIPMAEIRVVSNTTGNRAKQEWAIRPALSTLEGVIRQVFPRPR